MARLRRRAKRSRRVVMGLEDTMALTIGPSPRLLIRRGEAEIIRLRDLWAVHGPDLDESEYPWALDRFGPPTTRQED